MLTSCALSRDYVTIDYQPQVNTVKLEEVENVQVAVHVIDSRINKSAVGCKKNGYGMEMADIIAENEIDILIKAALESELMGMGFNISEGDKEIKFEIIKFINNFELGFWNAEAKSEFIAHVLVLDREGNVRFSKTIFGLGLEKNCYLASGKNARLSLERALNNAVLKIVNDQDFIEAIKKN